VSRILGACQSVELHINLTYIILLQDNSGKGLYLKTWIKILCSFYKELAQNLMDFYNYQSNIMTKFASTLQSLDQNNE
jgi:hypothetical protein